MAIELPASPKVYTTTYDNFKGVDFTNDSTNIWRRRSPTGVNMLPDASGRPFKRHGWDILLSQSAIKTALETTEDCEIFKCSYFELSGTDHIVVFTDHGVLFYADIGEGQVTATETEDRDCFYSYDRCFFFEGGGTSAFYIYGNYKMWRYDADFTFADITEELYIPRVIIGASADGTGTIYESYNLLYNMASVEYHDDDLFTYWGTDNLVFEVDPTWKNDKTQGSPAYYKWKYDGSSWNWEGEGASVAFDSDKITAYSPKQNDEIIIVYAKGLLLPNNVDINNQKDLIKVYYARVSQWDTEIKVVTTAPTVGANPPECRIHQDDIARENRQAWIEFADTYTLDPDQKDVFKAVFPSTEIAVTQINNADDISPASLVGGGA